MKYAKFAAMSLIALTMITASATTAFASLAFNDPTKNFLTIQVTPKTMTADCTPSASSTQCGVSLSFTYLDPKNPLNTVWTSAKFQANLLGWGVLKNPNPDQFCVYVNHLSPEQIASLVAKDLQAAFPGKNLKINANGKLDTTVATVQVPPYIYGCKGDKSYRR